MRRSEFDQVVQSALQRLPGLFRDALANVAILVEDWPDPDLMGEITGDPETILYGLFSGRPLTQRHYDDWGDPPAVIHIYRKPLEEDFPERQELEREIEVTVAHEIAHYMGIDEETLAAYGYE